MTHDQHKNPIIAGTTEPTSPDVATQLSDTLGLLVATIQSPDFAGLRHDGLYDHSPCDLTVLEGPLYRVPEGTKRVQYQSEGWYDHFDELHVVHGQFDITSEGEPRLRFITDRDPASAREVSEPDEKLRIAAYLLDAYKQQQLNQAARDERKSADAEEALKYRSRAKAFGRKLVGRSN